MQRYVGGGGGAGAAGAGSMAAAAVGSTDAVRALAALVTPAERLDNVSEDIQRILRDVASVEIGRSDPLMDSGIDSLAGVELKNKVEALYGVELPATAAFDYPSVEALAGYLISQLDAAALAAGEGDARMSEDERTLAVGAAAAAVALPAPAFGKGAALQQPSSAVAVLGWAGSAPAGAGRGAEAGGCPAAVDGISGMLSHERWDHDLAGALDPAEAITAAAAAAGRFGGWVPAVARFDAVLFGISVIEASPSS